MKEQLDLFGAPRTAEQPALTLAAPLPDYLALMEQAGAYAPPGVTVDMCRHPSLSAPTFWLFRDGRQIGAASWDKGGAMPWIASQMSRGMPTAQKRFLTMSGAILFASTGRADGAQ